MAGRVVVSTLNNDTGPLATQNGMTGIAKAWIKFDGPTLTITSSFNVSSISYSGSGTFVVNFTTALGANPAICANSSYNGSGSGNWVGINVSSSTSAIVQSSSTAVSNQSVVIHLSAFSA
jgi:hypothetical protein